MSCVGKLDMQWKALDDLLERVEKLEEEVYLLKPLKQEDKNIPEIYITENGTSFLLKDGEKVRKISEDLTGAVGIQYCLDGIKKTIDNLKITDPKILWVEGTKLILLNKETFQCLKEKKEPPELFKIKVNYLKEEIETFGFHLILNTNKFLSKKLSLY